MVEDSKQQKLNTKDLLDTHGYLKNKNTSDILKAQFYATQSVFKKRKIPFRSFIVKKSEETLGELFTFYVRNDYVRKSS